MIITILIASLSILGLHYAMEFDLDENAKPCNKEILWFIKYYAKKWLHKTRFKWLLKPLCDCPVCMSSIWGITTYVLLTPEINIIELCATVTATAGLNRILTSILHR